MTKQAERDAQAAALRLWWSMCYSGGTFERTSQRPILDPVEGAWYQLYEIPADKSGHPDVEEFWTVAVYGPPECPELVVLED